MPKQKISAKELITDIRAGMDDPALMKKYGLSAQRLQSAFKKLIETKVITQVELQKRVPLAEKPVDIVWKCPACGKPQPSEFDKCPECGVSVSKFREREYPTREGELVEDIGARTDLIGDLCRRYGIRNCELVEDIRAGMPESALMRKYGFSGDTFPTAFKKLVEAKKKEISIKAELVEDVRAGLSYWDIAHRHSLSDAELEKILVELVDAGSLKYDEVPEKLKCPRCGVLQKQADVLCGSCSVILDVFKDAERKPSITLSDLIEDIRGKTSFEHIRIRYSLSEEQLSGLLNRLSKGGFLKPREMPTGYIVTEADTQKSQEVTRVGLPSVKGSVPLTKTQQVFFCPNCGQKQEHGGNFCPTCGTPLKLPSAQDSLLKESPRVAGGSEGSPRQHSADAPFLFTCPACGKSHTKAFEECPDCGVIFSKFLQKSKRQKQRAAERLRGGQIEEQPIGFKLSPVCLIMVVGGLAVAAYFCFFFNTSVEVPTTQILGQTVGGGRVNNLGLMADRQNGILISLGVAILGAVLELVTRYRPR